MAVADASIIGRQAMKNQSPADRWKKALNRKVSNQPQMPSTTWQLERCTGVLVVGLGSLHDESRREQRESQLSLSLALGGLLPAPSNCKLNFIDPLFKQEDMLLIKELGGATWVQEWSPMFVSASSSPLIYMPCCSRSLVCSVINAVMKSGSEAALIGNSLQTFVDSAFLVQESKEEWSATREIEGLLRSSRIKEVPLPDIGGAHGVAIGLHFIS